jgi:hypothetical protein
VVPNEPIPALDAFLRQEAERFDCRAVPAGVRLTALSISQASWQYLLRAVGIMWAIGGVRWNVVLALPAVMFAVTITLTYGIARFLAPPALAAIAAMGAATSPLLLTNALQLRDFSKLPFIAASWFVLAAILKWPHRVLPLSALGGAILAIGAGFRVDVIVGLPALMLSIAWLLTSRANGATSRVAASATIAILIFAVLYAPLTRGFDRSTQRVSFQHLFLLGQSAPFSEALGLSAPYYQFAHAYDDSYVSAIARDYAYRRLSATEPIRTMDPRFNIGANGIIRMLIERTPADILVRLLASLRGAMSLPGSAASERRSLPYVEGFARSVSSLRGSVVNKTRVLWPALMVTALVLGLVTRPHAGLIVTVLVGYFGIIPAVQFHERHYFHLVLLPWLALAFVGANIWSRLIHKSARPVSRGNATRVLTVIAVVALALYAIAAGLRVYQRRVVGAEFEAALGTGRTEVVANRTATDSGVTELSVAPLPSEIRARESPRTVRSDYLAVELAGDCGVPVAHVTWRYEGSIEYGAFTHTVATSLTGDHARSYQLGPAFSYFEGAPGGNVYWYRLRGFELPTSEVACVAAISRVADAAVPAVLWHASLPADWRDVPFYQVFR